jgi:hypothetical protein
LWISVLTAFWSMIDYFKFFMTENKKKKLIKEAVFLEQKTAKATVNE